MSVKPTPPPAFKHPAQQLLLDAMQHPNRGHASDIALKTAGIDWEALLATAEFHGLSPLLHQHLSKHHNKETPQDILEKLSQRAQANALRNRMLVQELISVLKLFSQQEIEALSYKGPSLTLSIYDELGQRQFGDLDILIHEDDVERACALLTNQGYSRKIPPLSIKQEQEFIRTDHEHEFVSEDMLVHIDLHWALSSKRFPFQLEPTALFKRKQQVRHQDSDIDTISKADMLLLLCMHSNKDLWRKQIWLCDIDRLVRSMDDISWPDLLARAADSHCREMLLLALLIVHTSMATPLPESIKQLCMSRKRIELANLAMQHSLKNGERETRLLQCLAIQPLILSVCDSPRDRYQYIWRTLTTPTESDMMRHDLPSPIHFFYYIITPIRKLFRCSARALKRRLWRH